MRISRKIILLIFPVAVYLVATSGLIASPLPTDRTLMQLAVLPLAFLAIAAISITSRKIPPPVLFFAIVGTILGCIYTFKYPKLGKQGGVLVARLAGDQMQNETRIFREGINLHLSGKSGTEAHSYRQSIQNSQDASDFLATNRHINMLIWGNKNWINLFFKQQAPVSLKQLAHGAIAGILPEVEMIMSVPAIGMSFEPRSDTQAFIAELAEGSYSKAASSLYPELSLLRAAQHQAGWSSFAHRSYAWWLLGNQYMQVAIKDRIYNRRNLICAANAYESAMLYLRANDNPELQAAIFNNLGVLAVLRAVNEGKKRMMKVAKQSFSAARRTIKQKNLFAIKYVAANIAMDNLTRLHGYRLILGSKKRAGLRKERKVARNGTHVKQRARNKAGSAGANPKKHGKIKRRVA